ncbi:hypothetical protein [Nocardia mangyaensis]|uniref:hypothetical protein n=1 Tax=Nocardia mangyaensis TaxID=2213200 RepID=UPI0026769A96|nr:hypothetical protein [Nocardia mangyaensis]MDO3645393.1 hypothetical protein [Nocardia mangyaensis]
MALSSGSAALRHTLRDEAMPGQLVATLIDSTEALQPPPHAETVGAAVATCIAIADGMLDGRNVTSVLRDLSVAAAQWARAGTPLDVVLRGVHEGVRLVVGLTFAHAPSGDRETLIDGFRVAMTIADRLCTTVAQSYAAVPCDASTSSPDSTRRG